MDDNETNRRILRAQLEGAEVVEPSVDASYAALPAVLETAEWSVTDGLVSVIVRNDTDRDLRTAEVTMTARDENGEVLGTYGTSSMGGDSSCCTVQSLAPGEEFGLYFAVGEGSDRIDDVELADVAGLRFNVWTSIVLFLAAAAYVVWSARRHPGRDEAVYTDRHVSSLVPDAAGD